MENFKLNGKCHFLCSVCCHENIFLFFHFKFTNTHKKYYKKKAKTKGFPVFSDRIKWKHWKKWVNVTA